MVKERKKKQMRIAVDVGGTFTDLVMLGYQEFRTAKILNKPGDPIGAILIGISQMGVEFTDISEIIHGTTLGTNLLIEKKGPLIGFLTTEGFRDLLEIQRQDKSEVYNLRYYKPRHLVPRKHCFEIRERINSKGEIITPLNVEYLKATVRKIRDEGIESVGVCLLHSYRNDAHEKLAKDVITREAPDLSVTLSSNVLPQFREYERATATVINAYLFKPIGSYIKQLSSALQERGFRGELYFLQSNGGVIGPSDAEENPIKLVLSGPSGGAAAASYLARQLNINKMITMDMGGTSTDVSLLVNGECTVSFNRNFEGLPLSIPMIDIESIGAGGGSLGWVDRGGMLHVGPQSAGANPGPACYDRGGDNATVTDANVMVNIIRENRPLGDIRLNKEASYQAMQILAGQLNLSVDKAAEAVRSIANSNMEHAIRLVSSERGFEPGDFVLLVFGGAGPLHAAEVAHNLGIKRVIIPRNAGLFSAWGCLISDIKKDYIKTEFCRLTNIDRARLVKNFSELEVKGGTDLKNYGFSEDEIELFRSMDIRYVGQAYETNLSLPLMPEDIKTLRSSFDDLHFQLYGRSSPDLDIEIINYRVTAIGRIATIQDKISYRSGKFQTGYPMRRKVFYHENMVDAEFHNLSALNPSQSLLGPAVIEDETTSIFVPPGWRAEMEKNGNILLGEGKR